MQGSTIDVMSTAVEDSAVICCAISKAYKESTNRRMEAQYAFQQVTDMVPVMMEDGYRSSGWLGMMMGVQLWYGFYGTTLDSEASFEGKVGELCHELGERGKFESMDPLQGEQKLGFGCAQIVDCGLVYCSNSVKSTLLFLPPPLIGACMFPLFLGPFL